MTVYTIPALVWVKGKWCHEAKTAWGIFEVYETPDGHWQYRLDGDSSMFSESLESAKAACEAEWQRRMKASLVEVTLTNGVELIAAERQRQIKAEGWTTEHDDIHTRGELRMAAESYLSAIEYQPAGDDHNGVFDRVEGRVRTKPPREWPWNPSDWKPSDDQVRNLVKAGALIAAEIERLIRTR